MIGKRRNIYYLVASLIAVIVIIVVGLGAKADFINNPSKYLLLLIILMQIFNYNFIKMITGKNPFDHDAFGLLIMVGMLPLAGLLGAVNNGPVWIGLALALFFIYIAFLISIVYEHGQIDNHRNR